MSDAGGGRTANILILIEMAKLNGLEPERYLADAMLGSVALQSDTGLIYWHGANLKDGRMSDNVLRFIPTNPNWTPSRDNATAAAELLGGIVASSAKVATSFADEITFFDPGGNWSGVECAACGADAEGWFWEAFDIAASDRFRNLSVTTPCCSKEESLNNLHYKWPAGFGRFAIEALNPGISDTTSEQESHLSRCIGSPLRKIWVHI